MIRNFWGEDEIWLTRNKGKKAYQLVNDLAY